MALSEYGVLYLGLYKSSHRRFYNQDPTSPFHVRINSTELTWPVLKAPEGEAVVLLQTTNGSQNLDDADTVVADDETVLEDKESAQKGAGLHTRDLSQANYHQPASERT